MDQIEKEDSFKDMCSEDKTKLYSLGKKLGLDDSFIKRTLQETFNQNYFLVFTRIYIVLSHMFFYDIQHCYQETSKK